MILFWCSTPCGDADYFVVSPSPGMAAAYFGMETGFELENIKVEALMLVPHEDRKLLDPIIEDPSDLPRSVDTKVLAHWGFQYNETFHVFHRDGRIFRPEGLVRAMMCASARDNARHRRALRKTS